MKARVPIAGTVGKSIQFDPRAGARAEAAVAALAKQINAGLGGSIRHSSLQGLQIGDDHPQYTGNAFPETVTGQWNFATIPFIQGNTLAEYIEDVVGGSFFDFLQDTTSVVWTYFDTAQHLEANVPPEFVQDTIGAILTDTASIDLVYSDGANTITANIIDEYVQDLVGAMATDSTSIDFTYNDGAGTLTAAVITANPSGLIGMSAVNGTAATPLRSDGLHAIDPAIAPEWTASHGWADNAEVQLGTGDDLRLFHDGTDSWIRNETGTLKLSASAVPRVSISSTRTTVLGANGDFAMVVSADSTAGGAYGLFIQAGTNSSDRAMQFVNIASRNMFNVRGDGKIIFSNATDNAPWQFDGTGTIQFGGTTTGAQIATFTATNKPGSATASPIAWIPVLTAGGTQGYIPVFGA